MRVIGTAGHVDHGKSTLVEALTGIDPDRLAEEKSREMTINLGFAWLPLPDGQMLGIVDVPGHRDFIENMLAGVAGIDAALLVIAADEGVMPQTREHLAILDLLGVRAGLVVLSKVDLIADPEWLDLIEHDVLETTAGTALAEAPIVRVSARSGQGLPQLVDTLTHLLADLPPHTDYNHPRLPVDRVFTISGFGTVVTGTLSGGTLHVGDEVQLQPSGVYGRIRGLQSYRQPVEVALPGSRVAVNIAGVEKRDVARGQVLTYPGQLRPTQLADVYLRHLPDAGRELKHNAEVKFFCGSSETIAHARLLNDESLPPGTEGWLQLRLEHPVALAQGDRFILRRPSPSQTIGGGVVVNPHPGRRWRRFRPEIIRELEIRVQGTPAERIEQAAAANEPVSRSVLQKATGYSAAELVAAIHAALEEGRIITLGEERYMAAGTVSALLVRIHSELEAFHRAEPLRPGMPREELRSRLGLKQAVLNALLEKQEQVHSSGSVLFLAGHELRFTPQQQAAADDLLRQMQASPYSPPSFSEAAQITGEPVLRALIEQGRIVQVQPEVIFTREACEAMQQAVLDYIAAHGSIDARQLRDLFGSSRKYAIGLLEYLDSAGITRREGDVRVRGPRA